MKLKNLITSLLSLFALSSLSADDLESFLSYSASDEIATPYKSYRGSVDWLYWKVKKSGLEYAVQSNDAGYPYGRVYKVDPGFDSGVRAAIFKKLGILDFGIRYTGFFSNEKECVTHSNLGISRGHPAINNFSLGVDGALGFASSKYKIQLNRIDLEAGYLYSNTNKERLRPFAGVQISFIDQDLNTLYDKDKDLTTSDKYKIGEDLDMRAYGLYLGMEGQKTLLMNFGIYGRFSTGLSLGEFRSRFKESLFNESTASKSLLTYAKESEWLVIPNFEIAAGFTYHLSTSSCSCINWDLQAGYEFHQWCCLSDFTNFDSAAEWGHLSRNRSNLGFSGVFVRLNGTF